MPVTLEEQLVPAIERFGAHSSRTLLVTDSDGFAIDFPGRTTVCSPSNLHSANAGAFDLVVVALSRELSVLERIELPLLIHESMTEGACLLVSAVRKAFLEFPEVRVKFSVPPDGTDLTLSVYRRVR